MSAEAAVTLLARLADGGAHEPAALAAAAGVDATGLAVLLASIEATGAAFEAAPDGRLRLAGPIDWLDRSTIVAELDRTIADCVDLDLRFAAASSNDELLERGSPAPGRMPACLVEYQHGGRGRRGRSWVAPPGGSLCLSAAWTFPAMPRDLGALGLGAGVAAVRAIAGTADVDVGLKWPNDLVWNGRKLGGVLVEARADATGTWTVVGIGINVRMPSDCLERVSDWPLGAVDLATATGGTLPSRSRLAGRLLDELWQTFALFAESGFAPFAEHWRDAHVLNDRPALLRDEGREVAGIVRGIDDDGALLFETAGALRRVLAGEVSLRPSP